MSTVPIERISTGTRLDLLESSMRRIQTEIARQERQISTGLRIERVSDDPLAAVRSLNYQSSASRLDQYLKNIALASGEMSSADGALGSLGDIASRAQEIALGQISDSATTETRRNSATEVQELLESAVAAANLKFGGRYLFGGSDGLRPPVELVGEYVAFGAAAAVDPTVHIGDGESIARAASGAGSFGAVSAEIVGREDLDPRLTIDARLSSLNGGEGVRLGRILIDDGLGRSVTVDLSGAGTVADVIARFDASGIATASVNAAGNGISLASPGGDISVSEVEGGRAALDLGILASGAGPLLEGGDLNPRISLTTRLSDLRGGAGLDPAGFTIRNGTYTKAISLDGLDTVEDLLNAMNGYAPFISASIDRAGNRIAVRSTLSGARLTIEEGGGTTAEELGLVCDFAVTDLDLLNGGLGVGEASGDDIRFTDRAGSTFDVDIGGARTIGDVVDLINGDPENAGTIVASIVEGENRLRIEDVSGGSGTLRVESLLGSFSAENLGISGEAAVGAAIEGTDLRPAGVQVDSIFNGLIALRDALLADDQSILGLAMEKIERASESLLDARADVGARMQRLERTQERIEDEGVELQSLISDERGADLAEAVTEYQRQETILQATYAVTGRILSLSLLDFLG